MDHMYSPIVIPVVSPMVDEQSDSEFGWEGAV